MLMERDQACAVRVFDPAFLMGANIKPVLAIDLDDGIHGQTCDLLHPSARISDHQWHEKQSVFDDLIAVLVPPRVTAAALPDRLLEERVDLVRLESGALAAGAHILLPA